MIRRIFDLFRHGRAEADASLRDPFILVKTLGRGLVEQYKDISICQPALEFRWAAAGNDGRLRMQWMFGSVDLANGLHRNDWKGGYRERLCKNG